MQNLPRFQAAKPQHPFVVAKDLLLGCAGAALVIGTAAADFVHFWCQADQGIGFQHTLNGSHIGNKAITVSLTLEKPQTQPMMGAKRKDRFFHGIHPIRMARQSRPRKARARAAFRRSGMM